MGRCPVKNKAFNGVLKMRKAVFGLIVLAVCGFVVLGCDNGSTTDNGTAPTLTGVYTGTVSASAFTPSTTISKSSNANVYVAVTGNDPDADVTTAFYRIMLNNVKVYPTDKDFADLTPDPALSASFNNVIFGFPIGSATNSTGYVFDVYLVDSKGNKSATITSNTFEITN
jgi:hypothetical protein